MGQSKIKSHAKVNLTLKVVGKSNSLHKIESIVSFLDLHDEIKIKKIKSRNHKIRFTGKFSNGIQSKNTVSELLKNIDKKKLLKNKYQIIIKKNIPSNAGLGGGSMNAASVLNFFIKNKIFRLKKKEVIEISNSVGSDVMLGLSSKNLILKPNNSIKTLPFKIKFYTLITKPHFGCSTKKIYSKLKNHTKLKFYSTSKNTLNIKFFKNMKNDLETVAMSEYPKLRILKNFLENLSNIEFVRMTGSGSAIIAYFSSFSKCREAEKKVKKQFRNYWCKTSKTI